MRDFKIGDKVEFWVGTCGCPVATEATGGRWVSGEVIQLGASGESFLVELSDWRSFWFDQPSAREKGRVYCHNPNLLRRVGPPQEAIGEEQPAPNEEKANMKLYKVVFDYKWDFVEASSFSKAIEAWRRYIVDSGSYWADEEPCIEPESVELISGDPVIRGEP